MSLYGYLLSEHLEKSRIKFWNVSLSFFLLQSPTSWNTSWQTFSIIIVKHFQNCLDELFVPFYPFLWSVTFSKKQLLNLQLLDRDCLNTIIRAQIYPCICTIKGSFTSMPAIFTYFLKITAFKVSFVASFFEFFKLDTVNTEIYNLIILLLIPFFFFFCWISSILDICDSMFWYRDSYFLSNCQ